MDVGFWRQAMLSMHNVNFAQRIHSFNCYGHVAFIRIYFEILVIVEKIIMLRVHTRRRRSYSCEPVEINRQLIPDFEISN